MDSVFNYFDAAFLINLDKDAEMLAACERTLTVAGVRWERFAALPPPSDLPASGIRPGHFGCAASHRAVLRLGLERGYQRFLVFEDDVVLRTDFAKRMTAAVEQLQQVPWDIFYLGAKVRGVDRRLTPNLLSVTRAYHTHAYAVDRRAAPALVASIDDALANGRFFDDLRGTESLLKVVSVPTLATQATHHSASDGYVVAHYGEQLSRLPDRAGFLTHCRELPRLYAGRRLGIGPLAVTAYAAWDLLLLLIAPWRRRLGIGRRIRAAWPRRWEVRGRPF